MSDALNYLIKARPDAVGHYFAFLKACGTQLDPKTRNLISVISKVHAQTERGFRQYLGRALREGCTPAEVLDALLMAFPMLGLAKIVWAVDIILALDLPEFQPGAMGSAGEWHDVMATKGFKVGSTQRVDCDGRGLFVHRTESEWRVYDSRRQQETNHACAHPLLQAHAHCRAVRGTAVGAGHQRHEHGGLWPHLHRHGRRLAGLRPWHGGGGAEPGHAGADGARPGL